MTSFLECALILFGVVLLIALGSVWWDQHSGGL